MASKRTNIVPIVFDPLEMAKGRELAKVYTDNNFAQLMRVLLRQALYHSNLITEADLNYLQKARYMPGYERVKR